MKKCFLSVLSRYKHKLFFRFFNIAPGFSIFPFWAAASGIDLFQFSSLTKVISNIISYSKLQLTATSGPKKKSVWVVLNGESNDFTDFVEFSLYIFTKVHPLLHTQSTFRGNKNDQGVFFDVFYGYKQKSKKKIFCIFHPRTRIF